MIMNRPQQHNTLNVYRTVPEGCVTLMVKDHYCMPFIQPGECVVVDTADTTPRDNDVYVIGWDSGNVDICEARQTHHTFSDGETVWKVGSMKRADPTAIKRFLNGDNSDGVPVWNGAWSEGPFTAEHLQGKLVGAVIGIYKPTEAR